MNSIEFDLHSFAQVCKGTRPRESSSNFRLPVATPKGSGLKTPHVPSMVYASDALKKPSAMVVYCGESSLWQAKLHE